MERDLNEAEALRSREPQAWLNAYRAHGGDVFGYVFHLVGRNADTAEELTQGTWVAAIEAISQFDPGRGSLRVWLLAIARQRVLAHYRRSRRDSAGGSEGIEQAVLAEYDLLGTPPEIVEQLERADIVRAALLCLPEDRRQVLLGKYVDGRTVAQLAAETNRTEKSVESLLTRARAQLARLLSWYFAPEAQDDVTQPHR